MSDFQLTTPVAFMIFNRPDTTERVFGEIARARPPKLLVVGDGPRADRPEDVGQVASTRAIIGKVDWDCEVLTNFSHVNLGCRRRVSSGLDWVFEHVPEAIILEDDCLPHPTFFRFCEELLERYRYDERIAMISGDNFQFGRKRTEASYYFSCHTHIWGWASWRRGWKHYDCEATAWPALRDGNWLDVLLETSNERKYWAGIFEDVYQGRIDSWAYQWTLAAWRQGMLTILPKVNLVANVGFGSNATHTQGTSVYADMEVEAMDFPLRHPEIVLPHRKADAYTSRGMFARPWSRRTLRQLRAWVKQPHLKLC